MAIIRLKPSELYNGASSYLSISNADNAYTDTDSETYATIQNTYSSTSSRYVYLRGFNWDAIPSNAVINSFRILLKARESGGSTSSSYRPVLCRDTSTYSNAYCDAITTSATVHEFSFTQDFETFRDDGDLFGIRINCRRASRNTTAYVYIYGAEIEVDYTVPNPATVTSTLSGNGTIDPSGAVQTYDDAEYTLTITPTNKSEEVHVTNNGTDVTGQLVAHGAGADISAVPSDVSTNGVQSGSSYASYAVGHSAESPSSSGTSQNMYASSYSTGYAEYTFDFSDIPSNATIESIEVRAYGHRESATIDSTHVSSCGLYNGDSAISEDVDFPSTSNSMIAIVPTSLPSRAELDNMTLRHFVGYYGGLVLGITCEVTYSTGSGLDHYTYTYTVSGDATIAVVIGSSGEGSKFYIKDTAGWTQYSKLWKKTPTGWAEVDPYDELDPTKKYRLVN